jgi:uncharacterized heparinase superfamily protein
MSRGLKNFIDIWNFYRVYFIKKSIFYRYSLNKKHNFFDTNKFVSDPWPGNFLVGKEILDCSFVPDNCNDPINIMEIFSKKDSNVSKFAKRYAASFVWIRDLHAIGGHNNRKYIRNLISTFINCYRKKKAFWLDDDSWDCAIIGERLVNWILSYSFFASGSNDKFQKEVLSSIAEQFSHLLQCYKAEINSYSKLMALKSILFCLSSMKVNQHKKVLKIIKEIENFVEVSIKDEGMFESESPVEHFHVFRSLL